MKTLLVSIVLLFSCPTLKSQTQNFYSDETIIVGHDAEDQKRVKSESRITFDHTLKIIKMKYASYDEIYAFDNVNLNKPDHKYSFLLTDNSKYSEIVLCLGDKPYILAYPKEQNKPAVMFTYIRQL